jgi:hypothetical protein
VTCDLESASPRRVFRIGRRPNPWAYQDWAEAGEDGTFGNRWDDPESSYRVLYASSQRLGAFVETLSRFRPDPEVVAGLAEIEGEDDSVLPPGHFPRSWLTERMVGEGTLEGRYADVGHSRSLSHLRKALAARVLHYRLGDLDAATIRLSAPRRFTQEVSRLIYECTQPDESQQFAGVRYLSRLGDEFENWAVFEPGHPTEMATSSIPGDDPDFAAAIERLGLTLAETP